MGASPRVPIVGVPSISGERWMRGGWRVIAVLSLKMHMRWHEKSSWGAGVDAHEGRYFVW